MTSSSISTKRHYTPSPSRNSSPSRTPKAQRVNIPVRSPLLCTLPPTCNPPNRPTPLSDTRALESHYATHHAHLCSSQDCGCVFPDAHLLELHITECHNPIAALHKERGEKIFACYISTCQRIFANPKARRLHLISVHAYPKEYFFAVTNKGIGGLLRRWGDGASLLRGQWRPRDMDADGGASLPPLSSHPSDSDSSNDSDGDDDKDQEHNDEEMKGEEAFPRPALVTLPASSRTTSISVKEAVVVEKMDNEEQEGGEAEQGASEVDALTREVSALGLVPTSIRFGRGGSAAQRGRAGLATRSGRPVARDLNSHTDHRRTSSTDNNSNNKKEKEKYLGEGSDAMEQDLAVEQDKTAFPPPARGRRGRGRGGVAGAVGAAVGGGGGGGTRGIGRARGFVPPPPRAGFLSRGAAGRGLPRGMIANIRARGRGAVI
ncbi:hypothetical protein B0F90DRAFT_1789810 [Multifurca ochricompacta]|uniref:C2H2-type domain-containing protein n=1 Tax=Multifurca ochricompacta TaxID=376703 RepID=A0AAD4QE92_9AGAM|nr:hypothetical protein B0F90DRAFT_1789810 [Multifurca ochricompacta]